MTAVELIAARSENNVIGNGPDIPWHAQGEQKLFKTITSGGALIMGRKTFESIGRPLPGRQTIVISRNPDLVIPNVLTTTSLEDAIEKTDSHRRCFVAGGGDIYALAMPLADIIHLTTVHIEVNGDVFFPEIAANFQVVETQSFETNVKYTYQKMQRINT